MSRYVLLIAIFVSFLVTPIETRRFHSDYLMVWNVGQGSWATYISANACAHFDMGGESAEFQKIYDLCKDKRNTLYLSHGDLDHVSFAAKYSALLSGRICLTSALLDDVRSKRVAQILARVKRCGGGTDDEVSEIDFNRQLHGLKSKNDMSRVYVLNRRILLPGDASTRSEKAWLTDLRIKKVRTIILGHHGSRTSTSSELLKRMPNLRLAIASSRQKKFNHPHPIVVNRLQRAGVPVLRTEDWGNIKIL